MIKITNTGNGEIILGIGKGVTVQAGGGTAIVKAGDWEALLASSEVARSLVEGGTLKADKAK